MTGTDRNIVTHLGFPKTGTTTIQSLLDANTARLEPELTIAAKGDLTLQLRKAAMRASTCRWRAPSGCGGFAAS